MKCVICKNGETASGETTVKLERNGGIFIFKGVPAQICTNCGEAYLDEATSKSLFDLMDTAGGNETEIAVKRLSEVNKPYPHIRFLL